ncbi:alpha/beta-hydrolase [Paraphaeosphaeria sporulosa]|uniref:Carboxylic ester hydrolase n=1 Tax=Paraphaeosphaeria sporulosa TaxID=1460663 RepID=A0A177C352_9PLEO|nr:alpha/beta-hydrolase [Paraphaeosphaeria sporulosa]OAG01895.1 alpha/beta-hydrolase [Paraphaeosphaeria sporulosa]
MKLMLLLSLALGVSSISIARHIHRSDPVVTLRNGTYKGVHSSQYKQDFFLGIPYAQSPTGDLRFRNPKPLDASWKGERDATTFSPACVGYGASQMGYNVSEDCLYLNIIRPSGSSKKDYGGLPVAVWIYGGGFAQGSGIDLRYNLSFIVQESVALGQPMLGITLNYRLSAWGFLQGDEVRNSGDTNVGLRDQRLALQWIQENIANFGGDPHKVTIWGQSAGAASVGMHVMAYNGRDDKLFRSAIMESGGPVAISDPDRKGYYQAAYQNLTQLAGCSKAPDSLGCLRSLPYEKLNAAINTTALSSIWFPQIDGDMIARHSSEQLKDGAFVHVPILIGTNSDEGTSFSPKGVNNTEIFKRAIQGSAPLMNASFADRVLAAYPDDPAQNVLANLGPTYRPGPPYGAQYRRAATYYGDTQFIASQRLTCETWSAAGLTAYCFRFNAIPAWATPLDGATHFVEVAFAMLNLLGVGYPPVRTPPFEGKPPGYANLARLMSSDWIRFVNTGDMSAVSLDTLYKP